MVNRLCFYHQLNSSVDNLQVQAPHPRDRSRLVPRVGYLFAYELERSEDRSFAHASFGHVFDGFQPQNAARSFLSFILFYFDKGPELHWMTPPTTSCGQYLSTC